MEFHKLSEYFPMLPKEEFKKLKESIREHGLREAIVTLNGKILDGRNRYKACKEVGVEPRFEQYNPGESDALDFVVDMNMRRRHLRPEQKAQIMMDIEGKAKPGRSGPQKSDDSSRPRSRIKSTPTYTDIAKKAGVSDRTVSRVAKAQDQPDLVKKLREGKISAREATRVRTRRMTDKAKIEPTWKSLYKKSPDAKVVSDTLGRVISGVDRWLSNEYGLDKLDPSGHTPLLIKKTEKAINELERFKTALEELRDEKTASR